METDEEDRDRLRNLPDLRDLRDLRWDLSARSGSEECDGDDCAAPLVDIAEPS